MIGVVRVLTRVVSLRQTDDPFGPVDRPPDDARDLACDLTASDAVCSPPDPDPDIPDLPSPVESAAAGGGSIGTLLVIVLVVALVAIIGWIVWTMLRNREATDNDGDEDLDEDLDGLADERIIDEERPPDRWRRAAAEHRQAREFRAAVRCEYRALVGDLARAGHVDEIPGRTSGEERDQIWSLAPEVAPRFDEAADIFDAAWFDDAEVSAAHDERFVAAATVVLDAVLTGIGRRGVK